MCVSSARRPITSPPGGGTSTGRSGERAARRAGTTPGCGCRARDRARGGRSTRRGREPRSPPPLRVGADVAQQLDHRLDVADPGHVREADRRVRQEAGREDRKGAVLVPGGTNAAAEGLAPFDDEGLHQGIGNCGLGHGFFSVGRTIAGDSERGIVDDPVEVTRERAWETLTRYTASEALLRHALAVEASVGWYARDFGEDEAFWRATGAPARLRLRDPPDARQAPAGRRADPPRRGLARRADRAVLSHAEHLAMPRDTPAQEDALRLRRALRVRPRLRPRSSDRPRRPGAEVREEEAQAAVVRRRRAPGRGLRGRGPARGRVRRPHPERGRGDAADRGRARPRWGGGAACWRRRFQEGAYRGGQPLEIVGSLVQ